MSPPPDVAPRKATAVVVVAVELMNATATVLQGAFEKFHVPGVVVHAAGGDAVGMTHEPSRVAAGSEARGISKFGAPGPMGTVDYLYQEHRQRGGGDGGGGRGGGSGGGLAAPDMISMLSIDAEGYDPLVLRGATKLLTHRRVAVLEVEYHAVGEWATTDLRQLLGWLRSLGYACFWQSNYGVLAPALLDQECTFPKVWSNLLCAAEPGIDAAFESLTARFAGPRGVSVDSPAVDFARPARPCLEAGGNSSLGL